MKNKNYLELLLTFYSLLIRIDPFAGDSGWTGRSTKQLTAARGWDQKAEAKAGQPNLVEL